MFFNKRILCTSHWFNIGFKQKVWYDPCETKVLQNSIFISIWFQIQFTPSLGLVSPIIFFSMEFKSTQKQSHFEFWKINWSGYERSYTKTSNNIIFVYLIILLYTCQNHRIRSPYIRPLTANFWWIESYHLILQIPITPHIENGYWFIRSSCMYSFPPFINSCLFTLLHFSKPLLFSIFILIRTRKYQNRENKE